MKKTITILGTLTALALTSAAHATATPVPIGSSFSTTNPYFVANSGSPMGTHITAIFGAYPGGTGAFDYSFNFQVAHDGFGSGSLSTSSFPDIKITDVIINDVSYAGMITTSSSGQALTVGGIALMAGALDTIEVIGTSSVAGTPFDGTVTYSAPVPEPATWATFLLGFAFMGLGVRRKLTSKLKIA